jgi:hypothetical protein
MDPIPEIDFRGYVRRRTLSGASTRCMQGRMLIGRNRPIRGRPSVLFHWPYFRCPLAETFRAEFGKAIRFLLLSKEPRLEIIRCDEVLDTGLGHLDLRASFAFRV